MNHHSDRDAIRLRRALASALMIVILSGCAAGTPFLSSGPSPRVEDCMLLQQATPTRYVCGGKIYTATQLADIRKGQGTAAQK